MRIIFGSDVHGSLEGGQRLLDAMRKEEADLLVLCGDIYYHGPRNPLPDTYDPMKLAHILNAAKDNLRCVRGNCDCEVDATISEFEFEPHIVLEHHQKTVFVTHGHVYDKSNPPPLPFDILIHGHYHISFIQKIDGKIYASPGSVSLPKAKSQKAYLLLEQNKLTLKTLDGELITHVEL